MSTGDTCSDCGAPIVWRRTNNGKAVPLDPQPVTVALAVPEHDGLVEVITGLEHHRASCRAS